MTERARRCLIACVLGVSALASGEAAAAPASSRRTTATRDAERPQPRVTRPDLTLRATPSIAFSPATVMAVATLVGGDDSEEFYCPAAEWDWGDGSRSMREGDCAPFDDDTKMARVYSVMYRYHEAGDFQIRLRLRRAGRTVASASVPVRVLGRGDENAPSVGSAELRGSHR